MAVVTAPTDTIRLTGGDTVLTYVPPAGGTAREGFVVTDAARRVGVVTVAGGVPQVTQLAAGGTGVTFVRTDFDTLVNDGTWQLLNPAGGGTSAIAGGDGVLTQPTTAVTLGDGGRAGILRGPGASTPSPLTAIADVFNFDAVVRLVSFTGGNANTFGGFYLSSSLAANELRFSAHPDGSLECGYLGAGFSGVLTTAAAGALVYDGTAWLQVRIVGVTAILRYGQGTATDPPATDALWTELFTGDLSVYLNATRAGWNQLGVFLTQYTAAPGTNAVLTFDRLRVTDRSRFVLA